MVQDVVNRYGKVGMCRCCTRFSPLTAIINKRAPLNERGFVKRKRDLYLPSEYNMDENDIIHIQVWGYSYLWRKCHDDYRKVKVRHPIFMHATSATDHGSKWASCHASAPKNSATKISRAPSTEYVVWKTPAVKESKLLRHHWAGFASSLVCLFLLLTAPLSEPIEFYSLNGNPITRCGMNRWL